MVKYGIVIGYSHPTIIGDSKQNVYINLSENFITGTTIP